MKTTTKQVAIAMALAILPLLIDAYGRGIAKDWEKRWIRIKPNEDEVNTAKTLLRNVQTGFKEARVANLAKTDVPSYLKPVDLNADRMQPLCIVYFDRPADGGTEHHGCTCSLLKPKLAVTAAHCFLKFNVQKTHAVYVVQQYGVKGDKHGQHEIHLNGNVRRVIEWWYPDDYRLGGAMGFTGDAAQSYDIGFVRLGSDAAGRKFYTLRPPTGKLESGESYDVFGKKIEVVGYPQKYKNGEVAVSLPGILKKESECGLMPDQVCHWGVSDEDKRTASEGDTGEGTSGGPFLLSDNGVQELGALGKKLDMSMFSVVSFPASMVGSNDKVTAPDFKNSVGGLLVTQALADVVAKIDAYQTKKGVQPALDGMGREEVKF